MPIAWAQNPAKPKPDPSAVTMQSGDFVVNIQPTPTIQIGGSVIIEVRDKDGKLMIRIDRDGKSILGEGYKPDDGAKVFWEVLARDYPLVCVASKPIAGKQDK